MFRNIKNLTLRINFREHVFNSLYSESYFTNFDKSFVTLSEDDIRGIAKASSSILKVFQAGFAIRVRVPNPERMIGSSSNLGRLLLQMQNEKNKIDAFIERLTSGRHTAADFLEGRLRTARIKIAKFEALVRELETSVTRLKGLWIQQRLTDANRTRIICESLRAGEWYLDNRSVFKSLLRLVREYPAGSLAYSNDHKVLRWTTPNVRFLANVGGEQQEVDLEKFNVYLLVERFARSAGGNYENDRLVAPIDECLVVLPAGEGVFPDPSNFSDGKQDSRTRFFHPHIENSYGMICFGDEYDRLKGRALSFDWAGVFEVAWDVIRSYNASSSYVSIENWLPAPEKRCRDCGNRFSVLEDDPSACSSCADDLCPNCANSCASCSENLCRMCVGASCSSCGEQFCKSNYCSSKIRACINCECTNDTCKECENRCDRCNSVLCSECFDKSEFCGSCQDDLEEEEQEEEEEKEEEEEEDVEVQEEKASDEEAQEDLRMLPEIVAQFIGEEEQEEVRPREEVEATVEQQNA